MGSLVKTINGTQLNTVTSANYTITSSDGYAVIAVSTGNAARTITLPAASLSTNRKIIIKKIDSDTASGAVLITRAGSDTIEGQTTVYIYKKYDQVELTCDGTTWYVTSERITPVYFTVYDNDNVETTVSSASGAGNTAASVQTSNVTQIDTYSTITNPGKVFTPPAGMSGLYEIFFSCIGRTTANTSNGDGLASFFLDTGSGVGSGNIISFMQSMSGTSTSADHVSGLGVFSLTAGTAYTLKLNVFGGTGTGTSTYRIKNIRFSGKLIQRIR